MAQEVVQRIHLTSKAAEELGEKISSVAKRGAALHREGKTHQAALVWDQLEPLIKQQVRINDRIATLQVHLR